MTPTRRTQAGFTLIELMVSLVIFAFAMAGVLAVAVSMTQGFRDQRNAITAQAAVRAPLDYIADALRQASPGVSTGVIIDTYDSTTCAVTTPYAVQFTDGGSTGTDTLDVIFASGAVVTSSLSLYDGTANTLDVADASQFAPGDAIVLSNLAEGHVLRIASISGNTLTLVAPCSTPNLPAGGYPIGSLVIRAQHSVFTIGAMDGIPTLEMTSYIYDATAGSLQTIIEPLADEIEDLQVALGYDTNADGMATETVGSPATDEWQGNAAADGVVIPGGANVLHAVRISLVAREPAHPGTTTLYSRPALEDHTAGAADHYPRRVLRTTVEIRNFGASP